MKIQWSPPGEISKEGCWICWHDMYLYTGLDNTLESLIKVLNEEWEDERHIVG